jgi:hypothetical protein
MAWRLRIGAKALLWFELTRDQTPQFDFLFRKINFRVRHCPPEIMMDALSAGI